MKNDMVEKQISSGDTADPTQRLLPDESGGSDQNYPKSCSCGAWTRSLGIAAVLLLLAVALALAILFALLNHEYVREAFIYPPSAHASYPHAAVATDAPTCSRIGANTLRRNGSVVDAAIAASLCTGIFNSFSTGIGGGLVMTVYDRPRHGKTKMFEVLNARETAPGKATFDMFINNTDEELTGGLAIAVPGQVAGFWAAHQKYGRLPWRELFLPTIKLCEQGYIVTSLLAKEIKSYKQWMQRLPFMKRTLTKPDGTLYKEGDLMKRPFLAKTLRTIADEGPQAFYNGSLTQDILDDLAEQGSIITKDDLLKYRVHWQSPLKMRLPNGKFTLVTPPLPHGGHVLAFILNILDGYGLSPDDNRGDVNKLAVTYQRIVEAIKFAFSAKTRLGDEDDDPALNLTSLKQKMTSLAYGQFIRSKITDSTTHPPDYYEPEYPQPKSAGTSHTSIRAPDGAAVAVTGTVNTIFGSKVFGGRTGIIFNNEMDDFSNPNEHQGSLKQSTTNFIKPGKRPLSSMSPSMVLDDNGKVKLILGSSGGSRIITAVANTIVQHLWFKKTIDDAVSTPRLHHKLFPNILEYESEFPEDFLQKLADKGHILSESTNGSVVQAISDNCDSTLHDSNCLTAVCDRRKIGIPDGF